MYLFPIIYEASSRKRQYAAFSWATIMNGKGGGLVIRLLVDATSLEMWSLMKHLHGGHHRKFSCQILKK